MAMFRNLPVEIYFIQLVYDHVGKATAMAEASSLPVGGLPHFFIDSV